jgi:hypothetical protein
MSTALLTTTSESQGFIRCDSCPGRASYSILLNSGTLDFCNHHFLKNENALKEVSKEITKLQANN